MAEKAFRVRGLDCAEEQRILLKEVGPVVGGEENLLFDLTQARMVVKGPAAEGSDQAILDAVARAGLHAEPWRRSAPAGGPDLSRARVLLSGTSGALVLAGFAVHAVAAGSVRAAIGAEEAGAGHAQPWLARILYLGAMLSGGALVLPKAWRALTRLRPDMNLLMIVAVAGATLIGEWLEAATVSFLFAVSLWLESWSLGRARRAVEALMALAPETARVLDAGGAERSLPAAEVGPGSHFVVRPGERLPLDGKVSRGAGYVNQAPITGESAPVAKAPGDPVFAGTINGDGLLEIESTRAAGDTTLAHVIRLVEQARLERATSERFVDRFAVVYTPVMIGLALAFLVIPPVLFGEPWAAWIYRSLALLVVACPCALVISTPLSVLAGLAGAARKGVLVKGGSFLEIPGTLRVFAFDKTGTLTQGKPAVVAVVPVGESNAEEVITRAAALEAGSTHPLAEAIVAHARDRGLLVRRAQDIQVLQGRGLTGRIEGRENWLGSHRYLEEKTQETAEVHDRLDALAREGRTVVAVGEGSRVNGLIALADEPRPAARAMLEELRRRGVEHLIMLTGDNEQTARTVGQATGIDEIRAGLLPEDKVRVIEDLVRRYERVGMVGDGVNDAPALARATLGIAMGAAGSDAALETADVALMADDLDRIPWLIDHSRRTLRIIRANIAFSIVVKLAVFILAAAGLATLWLAIAADMGASLLVIANGLRLLR